jgi:eukaryotic-like serine/threonine-protein kinase
MDPDPRDQAPAFPARGDEPLSSNVRKAQVRAALFRKLEPVRIGRFVLLEPIGAGAMGEIYAAYDDQLDRKVAIKLVRGGSGLRVKADERLLREAQTLAQVSHPNVVQIYEAGAYNGRLFIAMELIRGKTLSSWLKDAAQVPRAVRLREILRQFIAAGRGLEAAHAAGLAHRDFKPDNVLVGDDGRVRVVDFGLARALVDEPDGGPAPGPGPEPGPELEAAGDRGEPTVEEALPAQPVAADTSHGSSHGPTVTLEVGGAPGEGTVRALPVVEVAATVHLPAPSGRAATSDPAASMPKLKAAVRLTETGTVMGTPRFMAPEQLRGAIADQRSDQFSFCVALYHALYDAFPFSGDSWQELRDSMESGEIELAPSVPVAAFVRKALRRGLSVEPAQRFASMGELLAALEPRARRLRSWGAAAAGLTAVTLGAVVVLRSPAVEPCAAAGQAIDAPWSIDRQAAIHAAFLRSELPFAESAWRGVKALADGYASHWRGEAISACQATHVAHTQSAQQLDKRMLCLDRGRRQLAALVGELGTGAPGVVEHAIEATEALPELAACSHPENLVFGLAPPPVLVATRVAVVRDQIARAVTLELLGRSEESLVIAREASGTTAGLGYLPVHAEALAQAARALESRGTVDARTEARRLYLEALDIAEAERHDQLAVQIWNHLVQLAVQLDASTEQAHAWWRRYGAAVRRVGDGEGDQAELHYRLGEIYLRDSKYAPAADEERRAIAAIAGAPAHQVQLSRYEDALARSLGFLDDLEEALRRHEHALALIIEALGAGHPTVIKFQLNYGRALEKHGQLDRARSVLDDALASMTAKNRASHPDAAKIHSLLSDLEYDEGHLDRAAEHGRASLAIYQRAPSPDHARVAEVYMTLGNVEQKRRNFPGALAIFEDALALRRAHLGADHYRTGVTEGCIAEALLELERYDEAMTHLIEAERIFQRGSGRERGTQAWILTVRGEVLAGKRQLGAAIPVLEQALALFGDNPADATNHALAMWALARALHELGKDEARVRALAEGAHAIFVAPGVVDTYSRDEVARFLARLSSPAKSR